MSRLLPLTTHRDPDGVIAWRPDGPVTQRQFLADVAQLAAMLPPGGSVLNVCHDRYGFMVGFAASLVAGKVSLLPSSHTPEAVRQLKDYADDVFCLHDGNGAEIDLPQLALPPRSPSLSGTSEIPAIDVDFVASVLLTSGSTGRPQPHARTWGELVRNGTAEADRLGLLRRGHTIVGTVPAQHSYGFESTVLLTLFGNCAMWAGRPFYPADIAAALAAVPQPRFLVTTPFHLRTLLEADVVVPPVDMLLSATAPLSEALAREAEEKLGAPMFEIYGCTETGQLATRQTTAAPAHWLPLRDVRLDQEDGVTFASGGHVRGRQALGDIIELYADGSFSLQGRNADMVNIAGKRTSLAYLNQQLAAIPGVDDGCFFMPDDDSADGITRLSAFVVAPTLSPAGLREALRARIDPIFLPRPLVFLERLPRNETGKLTRNVLKALLERQTGRGS